MLSISGLQPHSSRHATRHERLRRFFKTAQTLSAVGFTEVVTCGGTGTQNGGRWQQLADQTVPAGDLGRANVNDILRFEFKTVGNRKSDRRLGVKLVDLGRLGFDISAPRITYSALPLEVVWFKPPTEPTTSARLMCLVLNLTA